MESHKAARTFTAWLRPLWVRLALLEVLKGFLLGLLVALTLVVVGERILPALKEFDFDFALKLHVFADQHLRNRFSGIARSPKDSPDAYVFLDVDPEPTSSEPQPPSACAALVRVRLATSPAQSALANPEHCTDARPLNRYLLAQLVRELRARNPFLIILDVDLTKQSEVIPEPENRELVEALVDGVPGDPPVLYPESIELVAQPGGIGYVRLASDDRTLQGEINSRLKARPPERVPRLMRAIALAAPGEPVRRYPKCLLLENANGAWEATVPFLASVLLAHSNADGRETCKTFASQPDQDEEQLAPRIEYTLPSLSIHQDSPSGADSENDRDLLALAIYGQVYSRCLAAHFWNSQSACGRGAEYAHKVVIIGASNRLRRDRHSTPIGNMTGAEIIVNATRSFFHPRDPERSLTRMMLGELPFVFWSAAIWSVYFLVHGFLYRNDHANPLPLRQRLKRALISITVFWVVFAVALGVVITHGFATFSVVAGVLGVALEKYVEGVARCLEAFDLLLRRILRLPRSADD